MSQPLRSQSPPGTPESAIRNSLYHATSTVDDLTAALADFSRVPSPDPPTVLVCCCRNEDCENIKCWLAVKSKLESRLILSAEVGQALLRRHEAYVRRYKTPAREGPSDYEQSSPSEEHIESRVVELLQENLNLEKRLTQALLNSEVAEVSSKHVLEELEEARTAISRLTAHHARSVAWEARLMSLTQEHEDMRQERDGEAQRAKQAESRIAALNERLAKLQAQVRRLQDDLEMRRSHRLESSQSILQDARARLQVLRSTESAKSTLAGEAEVTKVLESLVEDNEHLKRDNEELQSLLSQSREDYHALQVEVEEQRANPPSREVDRPQSPRYLLHSSHRSYPPRKSSGHLHTPGSRDSRRSLEPITPPMEHRSLSPTSSRTPSETKWTSFSQPSPSRVNYEIEIDTQHDDVSSPGKARTRKPLFLLSHSRGVQTDDLLSLPPPSPLPGLPQSFSPNDPRSEASSITAESQSSAFSAILERVVSYFNRMMQADALSLTNRLKRQHLKGADVGHLSRSTVSGIVADVATIRVQFRGLLEDDKVPILCSRKDLRGLFKLFRDVFAEMGTMRITLNDVILDPSIAVKVRDLAMNPNKTEPRKDKDNAPSIASGWMAPITKLFASTIPQPGVPAPPEPPSPLDSSSSKRGAPSRPPGRAIPKLGPALAASATTVNVEFSGTGVGRSVTSTFSAHPVREDDRTLRSVAVSRQPPPGHATPNVMGIFAGAPRANTTADSWVKIETPMQHQRRQSRLNADMLSRPRPLKTGPAHNNRLSRNVDAVIDVDRPQEGNEEADVVSPLLQRTLRRRGMSDSSIHSTFASQAEETHALPQAAFPDRRETWVNKDSVLQSLSRRMQSFRFGASPLSAEVSSIASSSDTASVAAGPSSLPKGSTLSGHHQTRTSSSSGTDAPTLPIPRNVTSPISAYVPGVSLASFVGAASVDVYMGSPREDSTLHRARGLDPHSHGRDFF